MRKAGTYIILPCHKIHPPADIRAAKRPSQVLVSRPIFQPSTVSAVLLKADIPVPMVLLTGSAAQAEISVDQLIVIARLAGKSSFSHLELLPLTSLQPEELRNVQ